MLMNTQLIDCNEATTGTEESAELLCLWQQYSSVTTKNSEMECTWMHQNKREIIL